MVLLFKGFKCPACFLLQEVILHGYLKLVLKLILLSKKTTANYIKNYFIHVVM